MKYKILITAFILTISQSLFAQTATKTIYPLVISFNSECCGVPTDSAIRKFVADFKQKNKIKKIIATRIGPLGREGEYELAFTLTELSKKQAASFTSNIKSTKKLKTDKGSFTFEEKKEIDTETISKRARTTEVVF